VTGYRAPRGFTPVRYGIFDQIEVTGPLHQLYRDRLALVRAADEAGFERFHKSEHHLIRLDAIPQIGLFFAAAAQHTTRIRLASLVYLLPFHHPIRLSEEICSLDHLLEGRFDVGVGRGISVPEHELWGLEPDDMRANFDETLHVLRATFTTDSLTFHGKRYHFDDLPVVLHPFQQPHPPLWYAGNIEPAARERMHCIVGGPIPLVAKQVAAYREACRRAGWEGGTIGGVCSIYVAPTDEEARSRVRQAWAVFTDHLTPLFRRWGLAPPNDPTLGGDGERALDLGVLVAGSPATVREHLDRFEAESGTDYFVGKFAMGDLTHVELMRSIDLFASNVMRR
jgi:alkanesulfonate monooxygenase SsuD/methylene tetrahydromethanopterin reductase-like flavin-dependent oxidoreductase (luciferase family)